MNSPQLKRAIQILREDGLVTLSRKSLSWYGGLFRQKLYEMILMWKFKRGIKRKKREIKHKSDINVIFFVRNRSQWKYNDLYDKLENNNKFNPQLVLSPEIGQENWKELLENTYNHFSKDYNVVYPYNNQTGWIDVTQEYNPDIIFYSKRNSSSDHPFSIMNYPHSLNCYVPYSIHADKNMKLQYDTIFYNLLWKYFVPTDFNKKFAKETARNNGRNVIVSGYPPCDRLIRHYQANKNSKSDKNGKKITIIWAPHHTISSGNHLSTFLSYYDFMIQLTKRYKDKMRIIFKPHPNLKNKLYELDSWGVERTDMYYKRWNEIRNGRLEEGEYITLFNESDAMIFDSVSFLSEYACTGKPSLFLKRREDIFEENMNKLGKEVAKSAYKGSTKEEITEFIDEVVLSGNDYLLCERRKVMNEVLSPPNNKSATENIYNHLRLEINK